jgi:hypothetical protein
MKYLLLLLSLLLISCGEDNQGNYYPYSPPTNNQVTQEVPPSSYQRATLNAITYYNDSNVPLINCQQVSISAPQGTVLILHEWNGTTTFTATASGSLVSHTGRSLDLVYLPPNRTIWLTRPNFGTADWQGFDFILWDYSGATYTAPLYPDQYIQYLDIIPRINYYN